MSSTSPATLTDIILGTTVFLLLIVFIVLTFFDVAKRVVDWFARRRQTPDGVNLTLNQMYLGDSHTEAERELFNVAATEAMRRHYQGGGNG